MSCAVVQVTLPQEPGVMDPPQRTVKPYLMDLGERAVRVVTPAFIQVPPPLPPSSDHILHVCVESTNGTFLNGTRIEAARYVEMRVGDVVRFGLSTREYVLLHDKAA